MIRDYKIKKKLGIGSYGTVYLVQKNSSPNFEYVIKQISLFSLSPKQKAEVKQESKLLSKLNSKYVVKYYDSFEEKDNLNIVMEYCNYGDLNEFLEKHKTTGHLLNENFIWKIFIKISLGLGYIHSENILHRDLKSLNIFLTNELDIKIGDLGVAKQLQNTCFAKTFIGTPYYLSPEMCEEKPYNEKSDVWALGCILYELCCYKHPFNANSQGALILKIIKGKFESIPNVYSEELKKLVEDLLKRDFKVRPTVREVLKRKEIIEKSKEFGLYSDIMELEKKINNNNNNNHNNNHNVKNVNVNKVELNFNNINNNNNNNNNINHSSHKIKINNIKLNNNARPQSAALNRNNLINNNNNNINGFKINHINLNFNNLNSKNNNLIKDNFFSNNNWPLHNNNNNKKLLPKNIKITDNKRIIRHNNNNIINIMNKNSAVKIIDNNNIEKESKKNFIKIDKNIIENFEKSLERNKKLQEEKKILFNSGFNALNKNYKLQNNNINNNNKSNSNEKKNNNKNNNNKINNNSKFETKITKIEKKTKENNNNNNNNKSRPSTAPESQKNNPSKKNSDFKDEEFQIIQNNQKSSTIITDTDSLSSSFEENNNNSNDSNKNGFQISNSAKFYHKKDPNDFSSSLEDEEEVNNYYKYNLTDEKSKNEESFSNEDDEEIVKEVIKDEKEKKENSKQKEKLEKEIKEYENKINKIKNEIKNYLGESEYNFFMNLYKQTEKNNEDGEIDKIFLIIEDFINKKIDQNKNNLNVDLKELYSFLISYDYHIMMLKKRIIENFQ